VPIGRPIGNTTVTILDGGLEPVPVGGAGGSFYTGGLGLARGYFEPSRVDRRALPAGRVFRAFGRAASTGRATARAGWRTGRSSSSAGWTTRSRCGGTASSWGRSRPLSRAIRRPGERGGDGREDRPGDRRLVAYVVPAAGLEPGAGGAGGVPAPEPARVHGPGGFRDLELAAAVAQQQARPRGAAAAAGRDHGNGSLPTCRRAPGWRSGSPASGRRFLGVARVGVHDNFFSLGGHSLLLLQAVARLREETGHSLAPIELFEHPTVRRLAKSPGPRGGDRGGSVWPPSLAQGRDRGGLAPAVAAPEAAFLTGRNARGSWKMMQGARTPPRSFPTASKCPTSRRPSSCSSIPTSSRKQIYTRGGSRCATATSCSTWAPTSVCSRRSWRSPIPVPGSSLSRPAPSDLSLFCRRNASPLRRPRPALPLRPLGPCRLRRAHLLPAYLGDGPRSTRMKQEETAALRTLIRNELASGKTGCRRASRARGRVDRAAPSP